MGFAEQVDAPDHAGKRHDISCLAGKKRPGKPDHHDEGGVGDGIDQSESDDGPFQGAE